MNDKMQFFFNILKNMNISSFFLLDSFEDYIFLFFSAITYFI